MKRWGFAFLITALLCLPIYLARNESPTLFRDTDTKVLLEKLDERQSPFSWFAGDWPLENHFYRPVSTLAFEFDRAAYGRNAAGFGATNAILGILSVLALFWLIREIADSPAAAGGGAGLFALWILDHGPWLAPIGWILAGASLLLALLPKRSSREAVGAALLWVFVAFESAGLVGLRNRMVDWLPGRTASVMTVFALIALASYCRFERLQAERLPAPDPTPLDPPATKGTILRPSAKRSHSLWAVVSLTAFALALGSYEQAVMIPFAMLLAAWVLQGQRYRVRWAVPVAAFAMVGLYALLRKLVLPEGTSGYQDQQFRFTAGALHTLAGVAVPVWQPLYSFFMGWTDGLIFLSGGPWYLLAQLSSNLAGLWRIRNVRLALFGLGGSVAVFAPMAFLKHFDHYYFFPMAIRSIFVASLVGIAAEATLSAASRPMRQAPPRRNPAPGSLPRP